MASVFMFYSNNVSDVTVMMSLYKSYNHVSRQLSYDNYFEIQILVIIEHVLKLKNQLHQLH